MSKYIKYISFILLILFCILCGIIHKTKSKYFVSDSKTAFHINSLISDTIKPTIIVKKTNNIEKVLNDDEYFSDTDIELNYYDNTKINKAEYWYNEKNKNFNGNGSVLSLNTKFTKEGWYKIVVTDIFNNTNQSVILIDKTPPNVTVKYYKKNKIGILKTPKQIIMNGGIC